MRTMVCLAGVLMVWALPAVAADVLGIAPLRVILDDKKTNDMLTLTNRSDTPKRYKVVLEDQVMDAKGMISQQDDFAYSAKKMVRFMPRTIELKPQERQNVRVMVSPQEGLADGEYHSHIIFREITFEQAEGEAPEKGFKVNMTSNYDVGLPLIYRHGQVASGLELKGARLVDKNGQKAVAVSLHRTGNGEANGMLKVLPAGDAKSVVAPRNMHVYREVDEIEVELPVLTDMPVGTPLRAVMEREGQPAISVDVVR